MHELCLIRTGPIMQRPEQLYDLDKGFPSAPSSPWFDSHWHSFLIFVRKSCAKSYISRVETMLRRYYLWLKVTTNLAFQRELRSSRFPSFKKPCWPRNYEHPQYIEILGLLTKVRLPSTHINVLKIVKTQVKLTSAICDCWLFFGARRITAMGGAFRLSYTMPPALIVHC